MPDSIELIKLLSKSRYMPSNIGFICNSKATTRTTAAKIDKRQ
jgi:hypothetical protein